MKQNNVSNQNETDSNFTGYHNSKFTGYNRSCPSYGEMADHLEAVCVMPNVGDIVEMYDKAVYCGRGEYRDSLKSPKKKESNTGLRRTYTYLTDHPETRTINGRKKRYKVIGFTHGRDNPIMSNNKMILECVYPKNCAGPYSRTTITTVSVAIGFTFIKIVGHED